MERLGGKITEINLTETNMAETNMAEANMAETNMAEANMAEANMAEITMAETNMAEANMAETTMIETNIIETNRMETNLESGRAMTHTGKTGHTNDTEEGGMQETWRETLQAFWKEESGIGVIEVVLILVVLIGLVAIFKNRINDLLTTIFEKITSLSEKVY